MFFLFLCLLAQDYVESDEIKVDFVETVTLVRLPLQVEREGRHYRRLDVKQIELMENGVAVEPQGLREIETPLIIHFLLDLSTSNDRHISRAKRAARDIIDRLKPGDRVKISYFSGIYQPVTDYVSDRDLLQRKLRLLSPVGTTALYDGVDAALRDLSRQEGSRVLIVMSDGHDFASRTTEGSLMSRVNAYRIPVFFAAFPINRDRGSMLQAQYRYMVSLAQQSGGDVIIADGDLARDLRGQLRQRRKRFQLSFKPPNPQDQGLWRSLLVRVKDCESCQLSYRRGYQIQSK